jgi:hypothetical protein
MSNNQQKPMIAKPQRDNSRGPKEVF